MVRLRRAEKIDDTDADSVPAELKEFDAPEWRDPVRFHHWCSTHLRHQLLSPRHLDYLGRNAPAGVRWRFGVENWAVGHGFGTERWPKLPDWQRLRAAGVPAPSSLSRPRIIAAEFEI